MGFKPSKADPDIWMKSSKDDNHYEYIAVYVDDLAICMKCPQAFCDTILDGDIPGMKIELMLQIQDNMLKKSLSNMKEC